MVLINEPFFTVAELDKNLKKNVIEFALADIACQALGCPGLIKKNTFDLAKVISFITDE